MNNLKNKNKSISKSKKLNIYDLPISKNGNECLAPCYPPNTLFYHPLSLKSFIFENQNTCPINKTINSDDEVIFAEECDSKDVTNDYKNFNIFEDMVQIANTPKAFLAQIYNIKLVEDVLRFLNDSIDELPIYSQKRILNCMYLTFNKNENFPKELFSEKIKNIIKNIYKLNISVEKIVKKIFVEKNIDDIFIYLFKKYSKK